MEQCNKKSEAVVPTPLQTAVSITTSWIQLLHSMDSR